MAAPCECPYEGEEGEKEGQPVQTQNGHGYRHWPNYVFVTSNGKSLTKRQMAQTGAILLPLQLTEKVMSLPYH